MRALCSLLFGLVGIASEQAWAGWTIAAREALAAPAPLTFTRLRVSDGDRQAELHLVTFRARTHTFAVLDDPVGTETLASVATARGALAAANGGYFHPDRTPLGWVVSAGRTVHPMERARLLSGMVLARAGQLSLLRFAEYRPGTPVGEALQAGPFLVDGGRVVAGLNTVRAAMRTVVLTAGSETWGLLICDAVTLEEMAQILTTPALLPDGLRPKRALNLDGGSSSGLWVNASSGEGTPYYRRERVSLRTFVAVVSR